MKMTLALLATLLLISACETTQGFGRDLRKAGNNVESAAQGLTP